MTRNKNCLCGQTTKSDKNPLEPTRKSTLVKKNWDKKVKYKNRLGLDGQGGSHFNQTHIINMIYYESMK